MSEILRTFYKDPDEKIKYTIDWTDWLDGQTTIASSAWVVPGGITQEAVSNSTTQVSIWLSGGSAGTSYDIVNRITTAATTTEIAERTIRVIVRT